jgi:uncharacterized surface protein with fasciclin (FAS1) repeats
MRFTQAKTLAAAACVLSLLGVAGCADDDSGSDNADGAGVTQPATTEPTVGMGSGNELVGPGCADYAEMVPDGAGSVEGMAQDPVATAASNNPLLTTLVAAVSAQLNPGVDLVSTLNSGEFTVFAPVDDAFAALPRKTVADLSKPANADMLTSILTYHVVEGRIAPTEIVGSQTTVQGDAVQVTEAGDGLKVNNAAVICGGVQTANATVYLIDSVLLPPM